MQIVNIKIESAFDSYILQLIMMVTAAAVGSRYF